MCELALEGYGTECAVSVWPPIISIPGKIQVGQVSRAFSAGMTRFCITFNTGASLPCA